MAIEFALVFVLFFAIFYALVSYAFPLLISQSIHMAVAEGARVAVAVDPRQEDYEDQLRARAEGRTRAFLEDSLMVALSPGEFTVSSSIEDRLLQVEVTYPYEAAPVLVPIELPLVGAVPRLPPQLRARSSIDF
ncbi:TadE/TadG family type IV pilus assembly protein [Thioalkalivibrio sp. ALE28]|uniref:TadE/TadG family type IV pilus assembly protein n=1 Tax=Thioalkalivibrio sp. ALE28 TaxID=1158179 RepID=UPI00037BDD7B|nr:TadE family protein [Thioalkalivibrio sp. ALE28]